MPNESEFKSKSKFFAAISNQSPEDYCQTEVRADLSHSRVNQQKAEAKEVTLEKLSVLIVLINVIKAGIE